MQIAAQAADLDLAVGGAHRDREALGHEEHQIHALPLGRLDALGQGRAQPRNVVLALQIQREAGFDTGRALGDGLQFQLALVAAETQPHVAVGVVDLDARSGRQYVLPVDPIDGLTVRGLLGVVALRTDPRRPQGQHQQQQDLDAESGHGFGRVLQVEGVVAAQQSSTEGCVNNRHKPRR